MVEKFNRVDAHIDNFRSLVTFTAKETGFAPILIEKDYFCSVILSYIFTNGGSLLVFKGGTALNKIHLGFYRLSEDLDFSLPMSVESTRGQRSDAMVPIKKQFSELPKSLRGITLASPLTGRNNSVQYIGVIEYTSCLGLESGRIQFEVGLREPNLLAPIILEARTLLIDPFSKKEIYPIGIPVQVHQVKEMFAEKLRAGLCRREPAIRDLFDIFHAVKHSVINLTDEELIALTQRKLAVPGNDFVGMTAARVAIFKSQLETDLRPVLQERVFESFDFDESIKFLRGFEKIVREKC